MAVAGCLSAVALGAAATPAMAVNPDTFSDDPAAGTTLREAIQATGPGGTITLAAGEYQLFRAAGDNAPDDTNGSGDLDITKPLTIQGAGMNQTIIRVTNPGPVDGVIHTLNTLTLNDLTVTGGLRNLNPPTSERAASGAGGGIRVGVQGADTGTLIANRVKVAANQAYQGAGVFVSATPSRSRATFNDSVIVGNLASNYGGGITAYNDVTLNRSAVLGNGANYGGGLFFWASPRATLTATNSTIGKNQASLNGGGMLSGGTITFDFVTIANNAADSGRNIQVDGGSISVRNSIFAGTADNGCANVTPGDITSGGFNIDQGHTCVPAADGNGDGIFEPARADDRIDVPPTGSGGINLLEPDPINNVYWFGLHPSSVAIDTGTDFCFQPVDQRNVARPQNGRCDVGAIEQEPPKVVDVGVESFVENPDPATAGDNLTYDAVVRNVGNDTAADVVVTTSVPSGTGFVSASAGCSRPRPDSLRCEVGSLAPGQAASVQLVVKTNQAGTVTNRADVSTASLDPNPGNDRRSTSATVNPVVEPDPSVTVGLVKAVKRTAKKMAVRVGVNRRAAARVALFNKKFGTLVLRNVKFSEPGDKTVTLRFSKSVRRKLARLKKNAKLTVEVDVELSNGEDLSRTMRLKINKRGRIVAV